jgi:hypothetical protein
VLGRSHWDADALRDDALETLAEGDAVLVIDETACPRGFHGHVSSRTRRRVVPQATAEPQQTLTPETPDDGAAAQTDEPAESDGAIQDPAGKGSHSPHSIVKTPSPSCHR